MFTITSCVLLSFQRWRNFFFASCHVFCFLVFCGFKGLSHLPPCCDPGSIPCSPGVGLPNGLSHLPLQSPGSIPCSPGVGFGLIPLAPASPGSIHAPLGWVSHAQLLSTAFSLYASPLAFSLFLFRCSLIYIYTYIFDIYISIYIFFLKVSWL